MEIKVKALKSSKNVIKGSIYELESFHKRNWNDYDSYSFRLKGVPSSYSNINNFELLGGYDFKTLSNFNTYNDIEHIYKISASESIGRYVRCVSKKLKTLSYNSVYIIENFTTFSGDRLRTIKLKDVSGYYSIYNFELISKVEERKLKLGLLNGNEINKTVDKKFDTLNEIDKVKFIMNLISTALTTINASSIKIDIIDFILENGKNMEIDKSDIEKYFDINKLKNIKL